MGWEGTEKARLAPMMMKCGPQSHQISMTITWLMVDGQCWSLPKGLSSLRNHLVTYVIQHQIAHTKVGWWKCLNSSGLSHLQREGKNSSRDV